MRLGVEGLSAEQLESHRLATALLAPLILLLLAVVLPFYVLYDVSRVNGESMVPGLLNGDYLLTTKGWKTPHRGDIVVIHWSHGREHEQIVKRIIALPGDHVTVRGDYVLVNGSREEFQHRIVAVNEFRPVLETLVPAGRVFVMGDNRPISLDSRFIGTLPISEIQGRVVAVWLPITHVRVVPSPETAGPPRTHRRASSPSNLRN